MTRTHRCRRCVWAGVALSAALHAAGAAVFLSFDSKSDEPLGDREVPISLGMFADPQPSPATEPNRTEPTAAAPTQAVEDIEESADEEHPDEAPDLVADASSAAAAAAPLASIAPRPTEITPAPKNQLSEPPKTKARPAPKPKAQAKPKPKPKPRKVSKPKKRAPKTAKETPRAKTKTKATPTTKGSTNGATSPSSGAGSSATGTRISKSAQKATEGAYLAALQRAIARQQRYPATARQRQETGVATLAFTLQADGRISRIRIAKSSGHSALDRAALDAMYRLGRFKPIPPELNRTSWPLRVPIRFDLK